MMKQYTQSNISPGNCWQTAVACILEVDPETLPPQCELESVPNKVLSGYGAYRNVLNGYLSKHHKLTYFDIPKWQFGGIRPICPYMVLIGPTERTETNRIAGRLHVNHAVVGTEGEGCGIQLWDPHPSRAGLTEIESWGLLGVEDRSYAADKAKRAAIDEGYRLVHGCLCPACGLEELRSRALSMVSRT